MMAPVQQNVTELGPESRRNLFAILVYTWIELRTNITSQEELHSLMDKLGRCARLPIVMPSSLDPLLAALYYEAALGTD